MMKMMKKSFFLLAITLLGCKIFAEEETVEQIKITIEDPEAPGNRYGQSKAQILNEMMIANEELFGTYWKTSSFTGIKSWVGALKDLDRYVQENAAVFNASAATLREIGENLPQKINFNEDISKDKTNLERLEGKIRAEYLFGSDIGEKKDVRDVLLKVIPMLKLNIDKAMGKRLRANN